MSTATHARASGGNATATAPRYLPPTRAQHRRYGPQSARNVPKPLPAEYADIAQPALLLAASRADERFQSFLRANPGVYQEFKRRALELHRRGYRHFGGKAIAESIRYDAAMRGLPADGETYRWNNNYTSRMVRTLIAECPELAGFFETRELRSA